MKPKDTIFPFVIIPLGIAFVAVSVLLFLYKGKNHKLLKTKLKLGAIILSFSWFATTQTACVTCYEPVQSEYAYTYDNSFSASDTISGNIEAREHQYYSFLLTNTQEKAVQQGLLTPKDGEFNDYSEEFYFVLDSELKTGSYQLNFFGENSEEINQDKQISSSQIEIEDETNN